MQSPPIRHKRYQCALPTRETESEKAIFEMGGSLSLKKHRPQLVRAKLIQSEIPIVFSLTWHPIAFSTGSEVEHCGRYFSQGG
jgi:hypothetical protein